MTGEPDIAACAARLLDRPVTGVVRARGGGNNCLFRVDTDAASYALKYYPPDERDRLGTEFAALGFLAGQGERRIPAPVAADPAARVAVYGWIDGDVPTRLDSADLTLVFDFVDRLERWGQLPDARALAPASAACLTFDAALRQLDERLERLRPVLAVDAALDDFVGREIRPMRNALGEGWSRWLALSGIAAGAPLPPEARVLSPSDFGRHNMLRNDGGLVFVDFEYFGWDDRVKMICDFALHPGSGFSVGQQLAILREAERRVGARDAGFPGRMRALIGVFGLIWCLILLNVYLPEVWRRRSSAAGQSAAPADALACQLARAREFHAQLREVLHVVQSC